MNNKTCDCLNFQQTKVMDYLSKDVDKQTLRLIFNKQNYLFKEVEHTLKLIICICLFNYNSLTVIFVLYLIH